MRTSTLTLSLNSKFIHEFSGRFLLPLVLYLLISSKQIIYFQLLVDLCAMMMLSCSRSSVSHI